MQPLPLLCVDDVVQLQGNHTVGTDWNLLLDQLTMVTVPTVMVRQVQFTYPNDPTVTLDLDELDPESLVLFGQMLTEANNSTGSIQLIVDLTILRSIVEPIVNRILAELPARYQ